jgi:transcriptional regulator with PAS, ATPase and Fis domain
MPLSLAPDYAWPGNVRELEQVVRSIILTGHYKGDPLRASAEPAEEFAQRMRDGAFTAYEMLAEYCALLYRRYGTYEAVAQHARLDRRTAKKYVDEHARAVPAADATPISPTDTNS